MQVDEIINKIQSCLEEYKAIDVKTLDVRQLTAVTDSMIIATATSDRHAKTLSERVMEALRQDGVRPAYSNISSDSDWQLLDFVDVVLHIMSEEARERYNLEKLWQTTEDQRNSNAN